MDRFLASLLTSSNLHCPIIGYHGGFDAINDDYIFELTRRRANLCLDVTPLDTGYSSAIDGQVGDSAFYSNFACLVNNFTIEANGFNEVPLPRSRSGH